MSFMELNRKTILADVSPDRDEWRGGPIVFFWTTVGSLMVVIGGVPLMVAWLIPGVPPPGPFG